MQANKKLQKSPQIGKKKKSEFTAIQKQVFLTHLEEEAKLKKLMDEQSKRAFSKRNANIEVLISAAKRKQINLLYRHTFTKEEINGQDNERNTALYYTVLKEDIKFINYLLERQADPNIKCSKGNTVLHLAYQMNLPHIVGILLDYNASFNVVNDEGFTPLAYAQIKDNMLLGINDVIISDKSKQNKFDNNSLIQEEIKKQKEYQKEYKKNMELKFSNKSGVILNFDYCNNKIQNQMKIQLENNVSLDRRNYFDSLKQKEEQNNRYQNMIERQNSPEKQQEDEELEKEFEKIRQQIYKQK